MPDNFPFATIAAAALANFGPVMAALGLAGGKQSGPEYLPLNPKRDDHTPGSFSINRNSGFWMDAADNAKGGDLISLAAYLQGCSQIEAAERLAGPLGIQTPERRKRATGPADGVAKANVPAAPIKPAQAAARPADEGVCLQPVPADAPPAPTLHPRHGAPTARWIYSDANGATLCHICRFEPAGERKQFSPLSLWKMPDGRLVWKWKAPPEPRPLLGLDRLAAQPAAVVVLTEGEKARDAAARLLPDAVAMCWQGGALAVDKADWGPLAGRVVRLWPDADEPGDQAMRKVCKRLQEIGAADVRTVNLDALAQIAGEAEGVPTLTPGEPLNAGDDAADLVARGWQAGHVALLIEGGIFLAEAANEHGAPSEGAALETPAPTPAPKEAEAPRRGFRLDDKGVWFVDVKDGEQGTPRWICTPLEVLAKVRDPHNCGWGLLVQFADPDFNPHREIIAARHFNGEGLEATGMLLDRGLKIAPKGRPLLLEYLMTANPKKRARVTGRTGWHDSEDGGAFVLPDRAFGRGGEEWIFESDSPSGNTYRQKGTLAEWKTHVARLCVGNSRLVFAVSLAFASPLLHPAGAESGGFHLRSNSSDGKTTALRVSASVCGGPDYMQRWRATDNGLEALATQHCDAPLLLDELAQIDPKAAGECAYMLANGTGKTRAGRTGGMRAQAGWRLLFLSAGEIGLAQHMAEVGKQVRAGQELRLAEIPADAGAGMGLFENFHEIGHGADFAKALDQATRKYHGTAWVGFLTRLLCEPAEEISSILHKGIHLFEQRFLSEDASGQARRVASRFALVGAAGELATSWGLTGWDAGEAMKAAGVCFKAWLSNRGGEGNQEERAMLGQVREFLRRYGESAFTDLDRSSMNDTHAPVRSDRAGWRRHDSVKDEVHFFVSNEAFRSRVCKGQDPGAVGRLLIAKEFAVSGTENGRPWLVKESVTGEGRPRVVHILPALFEADDA
jgi:uncharacterized protein (DUF927 family)